MGLPLKERVRVYASELGFEACRFTAAAPPDRAAFFRQWLARGFHAEMSWLERQAEAMTPECLRSADELRDLEDLKPGFPRRLHEIHGPGETPCWCGYNKIDDIGNVFRRQRLISLVNLLCLFFIAVKANNRKICFR